MSEVHDGEKSFVLSIGSEQGRGVRRWWVECQPLAGEACNMRSMAHSITYEEGVDGALVPIG